MKEFFHSLAIFLAILALCAGFWAFSSQFYPQTFAVYEVDRENDLVVIESSTGILYAFYGAEDYDVNDLVSCVLFTWFTGNVTDDEIVSARYTGFCLDRR